MAANKVALRSADAGHLSQTAVFTSLRAYRRRWLRADAIAGFTVWAVLVPESLAYATIAGVSPVVGLYAAPPALVLYAAFGSSKHLVTGPMAATAALSAAAVAGLATDPDDIAAFTVMLALMTGVLALGAGLLRLGFLAGFISEPVLKGFVIGLALTIMIGQVPKLLGIDRGDGNFFRQTWELLGNLGAGLASGMVVNGSLSKTAVNGSAGARTQLSGLVVAALTVVTLLFLTGLFEDLPEATLAAVVIVALVELVDLAALADLYRVHTRRLGRIYGHAARPDFLAAVAAMAGVLLFDTLPGLFIGIAISLLLLLYRASKPHIAELGAVPGTDGQYADRDRHPENTATDGIAVLRVESGLFFANADAVRAALRAHTADPATRAIVLDAGAMPFVDVTAARMLAGLADDLATTGTRLALAQPLGQVRDVIRREARPHADPHPDADIPVYPSVEAAVHDLAPS